MRIYVSGVSSGPNPSPGLGIARSLREGYRDAELVAVDYSNRSSGIHWHEFDQVWLQRPWNELNLETYREQISDILESGAFWISGLDLEGLWLAQRLGPHPNLLAPPVSAFLQIRKPAIAAHAGLPIGIPPYVTTRASDWDLHAFCREHGWNVWAKGPYYEAYRVTKWLDVQIARNRLASTWATSDLFLQRHIPGHEESIVLCAHDGTLIAHAYLSKRDLTSEGKAWAGHISDVPEDIVEPLRDVIRELNWTGGAEIELIRDQDERRWLLDWNPRFPAWVYGATMAGVNLPAMLVERASGAAKQPASAISSEFARVVLEVPVRPEFPLPYLPEPRNDLGHISLKHPSSMPALAALLHDEGPGISCLSTGSRITPGMPPWVPLSIIHDVAASVGENGATPRSVFLESTAAALFQRAGELQSQFESSPIDVRVAYSVKTNPDPRLLKLARCSGLLAETISQAEVGRAIESGFKPQDIVLNGPGKWWPHVLDHGPLRTVFCDSLEELKRIIDHPGSRPAMLGVRIRPPKTDSRFGIPVDSFQQFMDLVSAIKQIPSACAFGVHFHMASSAVGPGDWWNLATSVFEWGAAIERATGKRVETLDLGGGWFPDDWISCVEPRLAGIVGEASSAFPELREIILEPGKALAQPSVALAVRVLEVRETGPASRDIVVDGSIAELPDLASHPHRVLIVDSVTSTWQPARRGQDRLLGRLCMEHDVLATDLELPNDTGAGNLVVICDAGAYDRSMSYVFGQG